LAENQPAQIQPEQNSGHVACMAKVRLDEISLPSSKVTVVEAARLLGVVVYSQSRRENVTRDLFREIKDENRILHSLLPKRKTASMVIRNSHPYKIQITKVSRYGRWFIPYGISKRF